MSDLTREDLDLLRDTAARFFEEQLPVGSLRELRDERDETGFDRGRWREMAEMGWAGILIGEDDGGIDFGYTALGTIMEQSGRTLAASPFVSTVLLGAPLIASAGSTAQRERILSSVATGEQLLALAHEEGRRHAPHQVSTRAARHGNRFVINGSKTFVLDGHVADQFIVVARTDGEDNAPAGLSLFLVAADTPGIRCSRTTMVDGRNAANIEFEQVEIAADALVGAPERGFKVLEPVLDRARAGLAAEMLGTGLEAFDRTIEYLKVREQFGVKIGSFQALKHRAAEMYCEIELTRSATYAALAAIDADLAEVAELASVAKAKACEMIELVSNEAVQMHGGIGMTDEADIGLYLKRARVSQQILGDALYHRARYATLIGI